MKDRSVSVENMRGLPVKVSERRAKKVAGKPLKKFGVLRVYLTLLTNPATIGVSYKFLWTVFKNYLGTQFLEKWGIYKIPIVRVDHPLDKRIPFVPEKVSVYLDFVDFFIRPITMLLIKLGRKKGSQCGKEWFSKLTIVYSEAGRMYKTFLSTMERPNYTATRAFKIIHTFDPHLLCVPSLHISIIVLCYSFYGDLFKRLGFSEEERAFWGKELYVEATEIAESVLYIKQHSVNCVPAALYMITKLFPSLFSPVEATHFVNDLFLKATDIDQSDVHLIKEHILFMYERFLLEGTMEDDWREPVIRWCRDYKIEDEEKKNTAGRANRG